MLLLFTPTGFFAFFVFLAAVAAFVLAIRFFVDSRRRLGELFPDLVSSRKLLPSGIDRPGFLLPEKTKRKTACIAASFQKPSRSIESEATKREIKNLRCQLQQQQLQLNEALKRLAPAGQRDAEEWGVPLERKDSGLQRPKQQGLFAEKLQAQPGEAQEEFDNLQEKVRKMEQQAWKATELTIQLKQAEESQSQLEETLLKKEERLQELVQENQHLHDLLNDLQETQSQSTLQRQQLLKKIKFLEEINADMQQAAEADRKLKNKMTRVAELESMIELMTGRK